MCTCVLLASFVLGLLRMCVCVLLLLRCVLRHLLGFLRKDVVVFMSDEANVAAAAGVAVDARVM